MLRMVESDIAWVSISCAWATAAGMVEGVRALFEVSRWSLDCLARRVRKERRAGKGLDVSHADTAYVDAPSSVVGKFATIAAAADKKAALEEEEEEEEEDEEPVAEPEPSSHHKGDPRTHAFHSCNTSAVSSPL